MLRWLLLCIAVFCTSSAFADNYFKITSFQPDPNSVQSLKPDPMQGLPKKVLKLAINAYEWAYINHEITNPGMLTIIDFDKPSYEKRLWVIDMRNNHIILHLHVAQALNSGKVFATRFSNALGSDESSLGIFKTIGERYRGVYGDALRVEGLEKGINDNAYLRNIVIHSEKSVTPHFIRKMGYAGTTRGCFAVNPHRIDRLIELDRGGSILFAYASDEQFDPIVAHHLSAVARQKYEEIEATNHSAVVRFFEAL